MKKSTKVILILVFISIVTFLSYQIISKLRYKKQVEQNIRTIPQFTYQDIKGKIFTNQNLKKATPLIIIYFNTECEYCEEEAEMIGSNIQRFKNFQLIFISSEKIEKIKKFAKQHQLTNYENVDFLHDSKLTFNSTFDINSLPGIILYDKDQNLIEKIKGQKKPDYLIKKLKDELSRY